MPTLEFEEDTENVEKDEKHKAEIEKANLPEISSDVKSEYERIDPSVKIDDLGVANSAILNAISKYNEMLRTQTDAKILIKNYQVKYYKAEGFQMFSYERSIMCKRLSIVFELTYDVEEVYNIFIQFSLKVINVLTEIVNSTSNPWKNIFTPYRAELIEIVNSRLISCANLLEHCNELQQNLLNVLNPMIDIFSELEGDTDLITFKRFLHNCNNLLSEQRNSFKKFGFKHKISLLVFTKVKSKPAKDELIYEKRRKYNEEEESFDRDISDWINKAYHGKAGQNHF